MKTAKLFKNGHSQAVRLPKEFQLEGGSVYIHHIGNYVLLVPKNDPWESMFHATSQFTDDFMKERDPGVQQQRKFFE